MTWMFGSLRDNCITYSSSLLFSFILTSSPRNNISKESSSCLLTFCCCDDDDDEAEVDGIGESEEDNLENVVSIDI
jgi:hypothetical protein